MLAPHHKELLTAYVDGELTARQRRHVLRLLRRSGEARGLLERLRHDSCGISSLPACALSTDLSVPILEKISQRRLKPVRRTQLPPPARLPIWTGFAAAASVLLLVGVGSFLHYYTRDRVQPNNGADYARQTPEQPPHRESPEEKEIVRLPLENVEPKEDLLPPGRLLEEPENGDFLLPRPNGAEAALPEKKPAARGPSAPVLASGEKEAPGKLERVEIATPSFYRLEDLEKTASSVKIRDRLSAPGAYRVELLCKDATRCFDSVRSAFSDHKINLMVDSIAKLRLKKPMYHNHYAIFLEDVTPEDAVKLLDRMRAADLAPNSNKKLSSEPRFEGTLVVNEMSSWDRGELAKLLCVKELGEKSPTAGRPADIDIHKHIQDSTEADVASALEGNGVPRPQAHQNTGIFLSLSGSRVATPELRRFMSSRKPYRAGTIQLFLVLRHVGS